MKVAGFEPNAATPVWRLMGVMSKNILRTLTAGLLRLLIPALLSAAYRLGAAQQNEPQDFFENRIRPILANSCYSCHTASAMGGLKIDSREALIKGGKSGPAIIPGKPEESLFVR